MIYLDYSATTKVDKKVLERFNFVANNYFANPNSLHEIGLECNEIVQSAIENICEKFNISSEEIIFTSGASESNNFAIKGLAENTNKKHLITTNMEHSSILAPISYLQKKGYRVSFVKLDENGLVDLNHLKSIICEDTFLVSINAVNSEIGIRQPIEKIGELLKNYKNLYFHSDITQCVGKDNIDLTNVDLASFSAHKIYSFKGIGCLIKKEHVLLTPLIHGGKSTSIYRSGTPQTELIDSIDIALKLVNENFDERIEYIKNINKTIKEHITKYDNVFINSNGYCVPQILNISILGNTSDEIFKHFSKNGIYISTKSACSANDSLSLAVLSLTSSKEKAMSSVRVSLSYKTTEEEINEFLRIFDLFMEVQK